MRVIADRDVCIGAGQCVMAAARFFDQDDEDGLVLASASRVPEDALGLVREAVSLCPSDALSLVEDD